VDEGNYVFTIEDTFGNSRIFNTFVSQPPKLITNSITSEFNGFQVSCSGDSDGYFKVIPMGGIPPYTFEHEGFSSTLDSVSNLPSGNYTTKIRDDKGCQNIITTVLKQPDSLHMTVDFTDPDCSGLNSGIISISQIKGGVPPFLVSINEGQMNEQFTFNNLTEGVYRILLRDKNGCFINQSDSLIASEIPIISVESNELTINLGDSVYLNVMTNLSSQIIDWASGYLVGCKTCLNTTALPTNDSNFEISVISKDGCEKKVTISVKVIKKRSFVISNIFSPDNDGYNDYIRFNAGNDVSEIKNFRLYDRWGSLIYSIENQSPGLKNIDWDGSFRGQPVPLGVYTWVCEVKYKIGRAHV